MSRPKYLLSLSVSPANCTYILYRYTLRCYILYIVMQAVSEAFCNRNICSKNLRSSFAYTKLQRRRYRFHCLISGFFSIPAFIGWPSHPHLLHVLSPRCSTLRVVHWGRFLQVSTLVSMILLQLLPWHLTLVSVHI